MSKVRENNNGKQDTIYCSVSRGFTPAQVWRQFSTNFNLVLCSIPSSQSLLAKQARMDPVPSNGLNDTPSNEQTMDDVFISMKNMRNMALKTEKDLVQLKQAIEIYHDAAENKQDKLTKTAISFQSFVIKDYHLGLSKTIEYVEKALTHCSNYEQMLVCTRSLKIHNSIIDLRPLY